MSSPETSLRSFSQVILALNASLTDARPWNEFLLRLSDYVGAKYATLILTPPNAMGLGTVITPAAAPEVEQWYRDNFFDIDPFANLPEGKVVSLYEYINEADFKYSSYYKDFLNHVDSSHVLGVDMRTSGGFEARLRVTRAAGGEQFSIAERARLELVIPHVRQAVEIYQLLETSRSEEAVITDAVEHFAVGTVILDHSYKVLKMNRFAASMLSEQDGVSLSGGRVVFADSRTEADYRGLLKAAVNGASDEAPELRVSRPSGRPDISVVVRQVTTPNFMHTGSAPAIALLLSDPGSRTLVTAQSLRAVFDLTPAEAAIAAALANGMSVSDTAAHLGVALNTVRTHLRSIFSKTGVSRQSQLVHLIHTRVRPQERSNEESARA